MKLRRRLTLTSVIFVSVLYCVAATPEDEFVNKIKLVTTAQSVDVQIPVFRKVSARYGANPSKVPPTIKIALVSFMEETAKGAGPLNEGKKKPFGFHGSISNTDDIPLGIAMMLVDYKTTGAADALLDLSKNSNIPRAIRDRCVGVLRRHGDDERLRRIATYLIRRPKVHDKQVALLAFAAMKKPTPEGTRHIMAQINNPTLNVNENIVALIARADMSKEAVDLSVNIMKAKPATASSLMPAVSDASPNALTGHLADFKLIAEQVSEPVAKAAAQRAVSKIAK